MSDARQPLHPVAANLDPSSKSLMSYPPVRRWDDWIEYDTAHWPKKVERHYQIIPTICFNCEAACGLVGFVDKETTRIRRFEGNPEHPGSRGRNCAKGPATLNQVNDPDRILYPLKRAGRRGEGKWRRGTWEEALQGIGGRGRGGLPGGAPPPGQCPRRPATRRRRRERGPLGVGRGWAHLAYQYLLGRGARRLCVLDGVRPPESRLRQRQRHSSHQQSPGDRSLLQPPRPANHRREDAGREADRLGHASLQHGVDGGYLDLPLARLGSRDSPRDRSPPARPRPVRPLLRPTVGELGGVPSARASRVSGHL